MPYFFSHSKEVHEPGRFGKYRNVKNIKITSGLFIHSKEFGIFLLVCVCVCVCVCPHKYIYAHMSGYTHIHKGICSCNITYAF